MIGAGAWGTALAGVAARAGRDVVLMRAARRAAQIAATRANPKLPGARFDARRGDQRYGACRAADIILIATPAQICAKRSQRSPRILQRRAGDRLRQGHRARHAPIHDRGDRRGRTPCDPAILSGPSFAEDVARGLPTAVTLAASDEALASALVQALGSSTFRPYHTTDIRGVEIGGAANRAGDRGRYRGRPQARRLGAGAIRTGTS